MPAIEIRGLNDYAVLWAASTVDQYGRFKVSSPVEIQVRWEDATQESGGAEDTVEAWPVTVYLNQAVTVGSIMWHGRMRDLPDVPTDLHKVSGINTVSDIKGRKYQRTATLTRYTDTLPTVE